MQALQWRLRMASRRSIWQRAEVAKAGGNGPMLWAWRRCLISPDPLSPGLSKAVTRFLEKEPRLLNVASADGTTALHLAAAVGRAEIVSR